jgi:hypothetical protein
VSSSDDGLRWVPDFLKPYVNDLNERVALSKVLDEFFPKRKTADELRTYLSEVHALVENGGTLLDLLPHKEDNKEGPTLARMNRVFLSRVIMLKEDRITTTYIDQLKELGMSLHEAVEYFRRKKDAAAREAEFPPPSDD